MSDDYIKHMFKEKDRIKRNVYTFFQELGYMPGTPIEHLAEAIGRYLATKFLPSSLRWTQKDIQECFNISGQTFRRWCKLFYEWNRD